MSDIIYHTVDYKKEDKKEIEKTFINYKQEYIDYLMKKGYAFGTVFSYSGCIEKVMAFENIGDWKGVANNINQLIKDYGTGGTKEELGDLSHKAVINALKRFNEFLIENNTKVDIDKPSPSPNIDDRMDKFLKILEKENITLIQCFDDYVDTVIQKGTSNIDRWCYKNSNPYSSHYKFRGGIFLTLMGASWFVSYKFYMEIDDDHDNWQKVNTYDRIQVYDHTTDYHKEWLHKILLMNSENLSANHIGLSGVQIINMAKLILKKLDK